MIRKLKSKDIDRIMQIWLNSSINGHRFIKESYWKANYNLVKDTYIPTSETFVYEEDTKIKGFISLIDGNYIGALFVDVDYQGNGIGKKLMKYLIFYKFKFYLFYSPIFAITCSNIAFPFIVP